MNGFTSETSTFNVDALIEHLLSVKNERPIPDLPLRESDILCMSFLYALL